MALPTLNATPKYSLTIPSSGQLLRYRPYLVKEEKILLMAAQTEDQQQIMNAIHDVVSGCVENVDVNSLTTYDLEYVFIQLRAKSVGETSDISVACPSCNHGNPVTINLQDVVCTSSSHETMVQITDDVSVELKHPSYREIPVTDDVNEIGFNLIASGIKSVISGDEKINIEDETFDSVVRFLESMTQDQFAKITAYFENTPVVKYDLNLTCQECGENNEIEIKGMQSFF